MTKAAVTTGSYHIGRRKYKILDKSLEDIKIFVFLCVTRVMNNGPDKEPEEIQAKLVSGIVERSRRCVIHLLVLL